MAAGYSHQREAIPAMAAMVHVVSLPPAEAEGLRDRPPIPLAKVLVQVPGRDDSAGPDVRDHGLFLTNYGPTVPPRCCCCWEYIVATTCAAGLRSRNCETTPLLLIPPGRPVEELL